MRVGLSAVENIRHNCFGGWMATTLSANCPPVVKKRDMVQGWMATQNYLRGVPRSTRTTINRVEATDLQDQARFVPHGNFSGRKAKIRIRIEALMKVFFNVHEAKQTTKDGVVEDQLRRITDEPMQIIGG